MNEKTMELRDITTYIVGHYRPCFQYHFKQVKKLEVSIDYINEVIEFTNLIGVSGDKGIYEFGSKQLKG